MPEDEYPEDATWLDNNVWLSVCGKSLPAAQKLNKQAELVKGKFALFSDAGQLVCGESGTETCPKAKTSFTALHCCCVTRSFCIKK